VGEHGTPQARVLTSRSRREWELEIENFKSSLEPGADSSQLSGQCALGSFDAGRHLFGPVRLLAFENAARDFDERAGAMEQELFPPRYPTWRYGIDEVTYPCVLLAPTIEELEELGYLKKSSGKKVDYPSEEGNIPTQF